jgi:hypothetical protein
MPLMPAKDPPPSARAGGKIECNRVKWENLIEYNKSNHVEQATCQAPDLMGRAVVADG